MAGKKKHSLSRTLMALLIGVPAFFSVMGKIFAQVGFESRLAVKSLVAIILLGVIATILLMSTWLCVLALAYVYLISQALSAPSVLAILLALNLVLLMAVFLRVLSYRKKMQFLETRETIHQVTNLYREL